MSHSNRTAVPDSYRLGIDVGGTNTDAVILDSSDQVIAKAKSPTTPDVTTGIQNSLRAVLESLRLPPERIRYAMLGTTHCTNAIATRNGLSPVGIVRLGRPATLGIEPLQMWPPDLRQLVLGESFVLHGGHEFNGEPLAPFDSLEVRQAARKMKGRVRAVAVAGVFSPVNPEHEIQAREILQEELGGEMPITLSSEIGSVGLLERESASALNATLIETARRAILGFQRAMRELGIQAELFLGQNDGTLMSTEYALQYPVFTMASGPSNSIRGAASLIKVREAIVVDIGGTTTDIGVLHKGFPRESAVAVEIGGVRANFRMPDLISIGLGGGSRVHSDGRVRVGPDSVGFRLTEEAVAFGGSQLTATDLAVAAGRISLGNPDAVRKLSKRLVDEGLAYITRCLEESIDRIKVSPESVSVIVVGGGSMLFPDRLDGVSEVVRPPHHEVANALGVAIAQVSGMTDRVFSLESITRTQAIDEARALAIERAVAAGADPGTIQILEVEEIPLAYLPSDAVRIKVKAAGALQSVAPKPAGTNEKG